MCSIPDKFNNKTLAIPFIGSIIKFGYETNSFAMIYRAIKIYHYRIPRVECQITFLWLFKPLFLLCVYKNDR